MREGDRLTVDGRSDVRFVLFQKQKSSVQDEEFFAHQSRRRARSSPSLGLARLGWRHLERPRESWCSEKGLREPVRLERCLALLFPQADPPSSLPEHVDAFPAMSAPPRR